MIGAEFYSIDTVYLMNYTITYKSGPTLDKLFQ